MVYSKRSYFYFHGKEFTILACCEALTATLATVDRQNNERLLETKFSPKEIKRNGNIKDFD